MEEGKNRISKAKEINLTESELVKLQVQIINAESKVLYDKTKFPILK